MSHQVVRLKPFHYIHVKDINTNGIRVVTGPRTFTTEEHEEVVQKVTKMVTISPFHYVIVDDPVLKEKDNIVTDELGQAKLKIGYQEVRFHQPPFILYPGERCGAPLPLKVVEPQTALCLKAKRDFKDLYHEGKLREAGEEWLFKGPGVYLPQAEVQIVSLIQSVIIKPNQALKVAAVNNLIDHQGKERKAGEEWLVTDTGPYLPGPSEKLSPLINAHILDGQTGLYVRVKNTYVDEKGHKFKAGAERLVTRQDTEVFFPGVYEEVFQTIKLYFLSPEEYCIVVNPISKETGKVQLGSKELRRGPQNFFLYPGESLHLTGKQKARIIGPNQCLYMKAKEQFVDENGTSHQPGDEWLVYGPKQYWPPMEAEPQRNGNALLSIWPLGIHVFNLGVYLFLVFLAFYFGYKLFF